MTERTSSRVRRSFPAAIVLGLLLAAAVPGAEPQWLHWGGPNRDFTSPTKGLAASWPEAGPKVLWRRELGDGYAAIVVDGDQLFTMIRRGDDDVVVALETGTGKTIWEMEYAAPIASNFRPGFAPGPHSTPAIAGDRIFTVGGFLHFHALDKASGEILWSHDLVAEMGITPPGRGYAPSPLVYRDLVILTPGGEEKAVIAFRQDTGEVAWKSQSFGSTYSSPVLAIVDGEEQIIVAMGPERAGLDPRTGELRWCLTVREEASTVFSTQLWGAEDHLLFGSSAYADGSRVIRIAKQDGKFVAEELWYNRKMRIHHGNAIRIGDYVYGSSGDFGPAFLMAVNVHTGEVAFRQRGFAKANFLHVDGKLIILDEEGDLAIATPSPEGIEVHARAHVLGPTSWTVPTLVGTRLFVRNREEIVALDMGS